MVNKYGEGSCCEGCARALNHLMRSCQCCPSMLLIFGGIFLLLGYFLSAETVKILWFAGSAIMALIGISCFAVRLWPCNDAGQIKEKKVEEEQEEKKKVERKKAGKKKEQKS